MAYTHSFFKEATCLGQAFVYPYINSSTAAMLLTTCASPVQSVDFFWRVASLSLFTTRIVRKRASSAVSESLWGGSTSAGRRLHALAISPIPNGCGSAHHDEHARPISSKPCSTPQVPPPLIGSAAKRNPRRMHLGGTAREFTGSLPVCDN
jgi:hypothetical protein